MRIISLFLSLFLLACGGGGGATSTPLTNAVAPPPSATPVAKTADLETTTSFEFMSSYQLTVELPAKVSNGRYFINICTKYNEIPPIISDYDSCKIRTFLEADIQRVELTLSESERDLVAQIWSIESSAQPTTYYFSSGANNDQWQISF